MIDVDWDKLQKKYKDVECIDINEPPEVKDHDQIAVFQHPESGPLSVATSGCIVYGRELLCKGNMILMCTISPQETVSIYISL